MSEFTHFEDFEHVEGTKKTYILNSKLCWEVGKLGSGWELHIKAGTEFDISVPPGLEWAQSPHDRRVLLAAAVHDELLIKGHDVGFASAEFRRALMSRGVSIFGAWILFISTLVWTALGQTGRNK